MRWSRHALRLVALLAASTTLIFGAVGGLGYCWCAPMGEARLHCCCPVDETARSTDLVRRECCEARELAELPAGLTDQASDLSVLAPAPLVVAWLPAPPANARPRVAATRPAVRARGSPGRRVHRDCSVYLL